MKYEWRLTLFLVFDVFQLVGIRDGHDGRSASGTRGRGSRVLRGGCTTCRESISGREHTAGSDTGGILPGLTDKINSSQRRYCCGIWNAQSSQVEQDVGTL